MENNNNFILNPVCNCDHCSDARHFGREPIAEDCEEYPRPTFKKIERPPAQPISNDIMRWIMNDGDESESESESEDEEEVDEWATYRKTLLSEGKVMVKTSCGNWEVKNADEDEEDDGSILVSKPLTEKEVREKLGDALADQLLDGNPNRVGWFSGEAHARDTSSE